MAENVYHTMTPVQSVAFGRSLFDGRDLARPKRNRQRFRLLDAKEEPARGAEHAADERMAPPPLASSDELEDSSDKVLSNILTETRILLPGTQIFLGFLTILPFSQYFLLLDGTRRVIYMCTFVSTLIALVLFVMPAAYHRVADPIRHKERFKAFANHFLVGGLLAMSISMVLTTYLVGVVVVGVVGSYLAGAFALLIGVLWWVIPLARFHERVKAPPERHPAARPSGA